MLAAGTNLGPYRIVALLGAGGMGEVYRAEDTRLNREVAVKVISEDLAGDPLALERFQREARVVATLSHPSILALYDIGTSGDVQFAVTELLEGETLRSRLGRGPVSWPEAIDIGVAIAEGLAAAHDKGIIHRDLKPENLFVTRDGRVKILDFGLARVTPPPLLSPLDRTQTHWPVATRWGTIQGTIGYMAPEQARGQEVDARSDLFALGCILYELVSGRRAFRGDTPADILAQVLTRSPEPLSDSGASIPTELSRIIGRSLETDPERRYPSARELVGTLRSVPRDADLAAEGAPPTRPVHRRRPHSWVVLAVLVTVLLAIAGTFWGWFAGRRRDHSLAVLPFTDLAGTADYLADGVPDSLINSLWRVHSLSVPPWATTSRFRPEKAGDLRKVGEELGVDVVLTGSIRKAGKQLSLKYELSDISGPRPARVLWRDGYTCAEDDLPTRLPETARAVVEALQVRLTDEDRKNLAKRPTGEPEAYRLYALGRREWNRFDKEGFLRSIQFYNRAIAVDPKFALAYSGIADSHLLLGVTYGPPRDYMEEGRKWALKAIELDKELVEPHLSLAIYHLFYAWKWDAARSELDTVLARKPDFADAHHFKGHYYEATGQLDLAEQEMRLAVELDPGSIPNRHEVGWTLFLHGRHQKALEEFRLTRNADPTFLFARESLAMVLALLGDHGEALKEAKALREDAHGWLEADATLAYVLAMAHQTEEARTELATLEGLPGDASVPAYVVATAAVALGDNDRAARWLKRAVKQRDAYLIWLACDPRFDRFRSDPRYGGMLTSVGLPVPSRGFAGGTPGTKGNPP
jgi:serine/threonine protein kinase/tetratricopeptide (TPR) repeat protein